MRNTTTCRFLLAMCATMFSVSLSSDSDPCLFSSVVFFLRSCAGGGAGLMEQSKMLCVFSRSVALYDAVYVFLSFLASGRPLAQVCCELL
jgi:hypothetical protein